MNTPFSITEADLIANMNLADAKAFYKERVLENEQIKKDAGFLFNNSMFSLSEIQAVTLQIALETEIAGGKTMEDIFEYSDKNKEPVEMTISQAYQLLGLGVQTYSGIELTRRNKIVEINNCNTIAELQQVSLVL